MTEPVPAGGRMIAAAESRDLRRVGINPDFWYPVALSASLRSGGTLAARFAGQRIALYRGAGGQVYALEDRCAHRQVPLSMGVVEGDALRCCYHGWAYRGNGRIWQIPYLPRSAPRPPRGVRAYPVHEAYGLVFVFPGDPDRAGAAPMPDLPEFDSAGHETMTFSRTVACHYSFLHENLLDMNHQFLHRGVVGRIQPELLGYQAGPDSVAARYRFTHAGGKKSLGAGLLSGAAGRGGAPDILTIRTGYPYQTLQLNAAGAGRPAFRLWAAYVPEDAAQRASHAYGLLMIAKPPVPWALRLAWPFIRRFTERVFAEDRLAVESEQRAWDEQGEDRNREVFPLILDVRDVLRSNGVPIRLGGSGRGCAVVVYGVRLLQAAHGVGPGDGQRGAGGRPGDEAGGGQRLACPLTARSARRGRLSSPSLGVASGSGTPLPTALAGRSNDGAITRGIADPASRSPRHSPSPTRPSSARPGGAQANG